MISEEQLERVRAEDLDVLVELDACGLLVGADETAAEYGARLVALRARLDEMETALAERGVYEIEGLAFPAAMRIPQALIAGVSETTRRHYGFAIDWVPGFFADQSFGWLFGGCAYSFEPEFFALFIIRKSFATRNRWLIYKRDELLAHELCHVARGGLQANFFEEEFAYGVSTSAFRKLVGGLFRSGNEAFYILGAALLLLLVQVVRLFFWPALPIWPFWLGMGGVVGYFVARLVQLRRLIKQARRNLGRILPDTLECVLFRCTDAEVLAIARSPDEDELRAWLASRPADSLRWNVIHRRFLSAGEGVGSGLAD